jgi:hypothetical protein
MFTLKSEEVQATSLKKQLTSMVLIKNDKFIFLAMDKLESLVMLAFKMSLAAVSLTTACSPVASLMLGDIWLLLK